MFLGIPLQKCMQFLTPYRRFHTTNYFWLTIFMVTLRNSMNRSGIVWLWYYNCAKKRNSMEILNLAATLRRRLIVIFVCYSDRKQVYVFSIVWCYKANIMYIGVSVRAALFFMANEIQTITFYFSLKIKFRRDK